MKGLSALRPRIRKKIVLRGHTEIGSCWIWQGATTAARHTMSYAKADTVHRKAERAASFKRRLPQVWCPEKKMMVPAHRRIFCDLGGIPYEEMPECLRCDEDLCVNPNHLTVKGPHRQQLQPDLTKVIKARTQETRDAIWERLMKVQPMPGLTCQTVADECGLVEVSQELLEEYERWHHQNPHLIRDDDPDED